MYPLIINRYVKLFDSKQALDFLVHIVINTDYSNEIKKQSVDMLQITYTHLPLEVIKEIYKTKIYREKISFCLPYCKDENVHDFAIEVLVGAQSNYVISNAIATLVPEKFSQRDIDLLKDVYSSTNDVYIRYNIIEKLGKTNIVDLNMEW